MRRILNSVCGLIIVFLVIGGGKLFAQDDYLFENLNVADGLSSSRFNSINTVYQDKFGFMWFGTVDGLNRYDGYTFEVFKNIPGDSTSLPSSNIQNINEDGEGNLWIGTPGNMSVFNRENNTFTNYPTALAVNTQQANIKVTRSYLDSKNNFWVATQGSGIQKFNRETKSFEIVPLLVKLDGTDTLTAIKNSAVFGMLELKNGNFLISSYTKGIFFYNETLHEFEKYTLAGNDSPLGIIEIYEDRSGNIWFGGRNTIIKYNPITFNYEKIDDWKEFGSSARDNFFWNFSQFDDGTLFFNSLRLGMCKYSTTTKKFSFVNIEGELGERGIGKLPASKYVDKFGVYWIGLFDNGILKFDPQKKPFKFHSISDENVNQNALSFVASIVSNPANKDEIFLATNQKGIFKYNIKKDNIVPLSIKIPEIYSNNSNVNNILIDDDQRIWFSPTNTDIASYDLNSKKTENIKILKGNIAFGNENIKRLEYMPKNRILISTNSGIYILNTKSKKIDKLPSIANRIYNKSLIEEVRTLTKQGNIIVSFNEVGESANLTKDFSLNEKGNFLLVCLGEGRYPQGMFDYGSLTNESGKILWSMDKFNKTFHGGGGIKNRVRIDTINLDPGKYNLSFNSDIGHSYANFNVDPPTDSTWYGIKIIKLGNPESERIGKLIENDKKTKQYADFLESDDILASRKYPNTLWFGAGNNGLIRYDFSSGNYKQYRFKEFSKAQISVSQLFEDSKGLLWIVTNPSGFYRFDPEKEKLYSNAEIPDVPQTAINSLIEDFKGNIWINSSGGITKLIKPVKDSIWSITKYDSKDGVPGGIGGGSLITNSGEILFGSFNGFISFYPSSENEYPPIPVIENMNISEVSIFDPESTVKLNKSIYELKDISLSYAQNDISFDFASLHYSRPSKNRVSYKLEGFNKKWNYTSRNFASFTNLEPGDYSFKVRAISGYGIPSKTERSINITILPPWYRTTIAYIGYGLLFVGLIFGIDRFQRRRLLSKAKERMKIQEAEHRAEAAELQARAVEAENLRKTEELEEARQLQLSMLPKELPQLPHLDIAVYMKTATEVGGDYYDFHIGLDGTLTVVVGDATGHGMKAGTMVTTTKSLFNVLAPNPNIVETFHEMTRCLKLMQMQNLSMCMTMLKITGSKIQMSAAGMPPVFIYKRENQTIEEHVMKGMPLGTFSEFPYTIINNELNPGDTILLMSDGFPELFNDKKEMYGYKRARNYFEEIAGESPEEIINKLKDAGSDWTNDQDPDDDVTFVVIKVK